MPLIYRAMRADGDKPELGYSASSLGVRVPPDGSPDITPDENGVVYPDSGGMSVAPSWRRLPTHRIPKRLKSKAPDAIGSNSLFCWRMGDGPFLKEALTGDLALSPDAGEDPAHGVVEPARAMPMSAYQAAIGATREQWTVDEE
jgi:hypothetical protein